MLNNLTFEKAKEVIRLAEQARLSPDGRADDPQRGGPGGRDGLTRPATPPEPQPAPTWAQAFSLFLHDLSEEALAELTDLYDRGRSAPGASLAVTGAAALSHAERVEYLSSRTDLVERLQTALANLP